MKQTFINYFPFITIALITIMLLSLHFGWLHIFFVDTEHGHVQGIDYFAVPKSFLNLLEKHSVYDTWGGTPYGPYGTWYLAHPAFSVFIASWFSFFSPWTGYWMFIIFSFLIMAYCGYLISKTTNNLFNKQLSYFILLCAFPTYWMLFVGNMHAPLILALTLVLTGIYELTYSENDADTSAANKKLFAGLLISFFSKPIVLLILPLLLFTKETRKTTIKSIFIYAIVSFIFIALPLFNPQGIGFNKLMHIAFDFDFIKQNMNIYKNNFVLNEYMKDNSIHWLNLIAQSDYKLMHIDIFSLPVFMDTLVGHETSANLYKIPIYISLLLSGAVPFIEDKKIRLESTLLLIMAISLTFFLSYNTVWEYQFTSALPVVAFLPVLKERNVFYKKYIPVLFFTGLLFCFPSFYFLVRGGNFNSSIGLTIIRLDRVIPSVILFSIMILQIIGIVKRHAHFSKLKIPEPEKLFFE
jgi:hypothetical protein